MISAVILAAGMSRRMGKPKMLLPWGGLSVIEKVVITLLDGGISTIIVVTGGAKTEVEEVIQKYPVVKPIFNPDYSSGDMLKSLQAGLSVIPASVSGIMVALGDQPQVQLHTIIAMKDLHDQLPDQIIVPSYQKRRGHPWIIPKHRIEEIINLKPPYTMRDYFLEHEDSIHYLLTDSFSVIADIDTMEDYERDKPR